MWQGCNLSPILFKLYINEFACQLDKSTAPGLNLNGTEIKGLLYTDDLVLLSPTKEGLQQHLNPLHTFCQSWVQTVNPKKTKIIFQKLSEVRTTHTISIWTPLNYNIQLKLQAAMNGPLQSTRVGACCHRVCWCLHMLTSGLVVAANYY